MSHLIEIDFSLSYQEDLTFLFHHYLKATFILSFLIKQWFEIILHTY